MLELRRKVEELQDRCREYELTRTKHLTTKKDQANKELIKDLEDADAHIQELRVQMDNLEVENRALKKDLRQLEEQVGKKRPPSAGGEMTGMLKRENEQLKQEVRSLRERVSTLSHELEQA